MEKFMENHIPQPWYTGIQKKYAMLAGLVLALCVFAATWLVCSLQYESKERAVLETYRESLDSWVTGTAKAMSLWAAALEEQARRVSGSDLYRLFASELAQMDEQTTALINDAESGVTLPDNLAHLAEEVPAIRNLLLDFMNYSGLQDARIVSLTGKTLLSALSRPTPVTPEQLDAVKRAAREGAMIFAPVRPSASGLVIDAADPMNSAMAQDNGETPVAALLITTPVTGHIAQFLARDLRRQDVKPHLLQKNGDHWEEILVQAPAPVAVASGLVAGMKDDGGSATLPFGLRPGLGGEGDVYSCGVQVKGMDWLVVLEVPAASVNSDLNSLALMIYGIGALVSIGAVLGIALLWWILVGRQQRAIAERFENLYTVIARQKRLLDSVNLSLDVGLFMADTSGAIQLGNRAFANIAHTDEDTLPGNTLSALFDGTVAGVLLDNIRAVSGQEDDITFEVTLQQPNGDHLYRVNLFPFEDPADAKARGAVAIMQDITEFRRNSEKRRLQQIHTMDAFVRAVEGVDPYLSGHSQKMASLGGLLAERMGLSEADRNTIAMAASLSQVGKLFVPRELLGKSGKLTEEEQAEIAKVPEHAYRVLKDIDFDLPVPQAVYAMYERMDGSGYPLRLKGEAINVHARVLAVANAFCAMVSPRSYRKGMTFDEAVEQLRASGAIYDPNIVELLAEVLRTPEGAQAAM